MKELKNICDRLQVLATSPLQAVMAQVVRVEGSSYRGVGTRMLITSDGRWTGTISGGCLERDALARASRILSGGEPQIVTYDTTDPAEGGSWEAALGCQGVIDVLLEPIDPAGSYAGLLHDWQALKDFAGLATVFRCAKGADWKVGDKLFLSDDGRVSFPTGRRSMQAPLLPLLRQAVKERKSRLLPVLYEGLEAEVLLELIPPPVSLLVFGAGFDAAPLLRMAGELGWQSVLCDFRRDKLQPLHFPDAVRMVLAEQEKPLPEFPIKPTTAAVVMSHNYRFDKKVLAHLIRAGLPYIGVLGPARRTSQILDELEERGIRPADSAVIHAPLGLDIGAEGPEAIALATCAEIIAVLSGRGAGFLKDRSAPIHEREMPEPVIRL